MTELPDPELPVQDFPLVARGRRRGPQWVRVSRGIHRRADAPDPFVAEVCAWQLLLPDKAVFAGITSARLRGWDLPPLAEALPVCVAMEYGRTAPVRQGLRVTRHPDPPPYDVVDGIRIATTAETLLTCAPVLSLLDLVVLVDSALRAGDVELLELWITAGRRRRGAPRLRDALLLCDPLAESVMETLLRVLHVVCALEVRSQHVVLDEDGVFVARSDLWLIGTRTLPEYDGAHHAEPRQRRKDLRRDRRVARAGWRRNGYSDADLMRRPVTILRDADEAVGRPHDPARIRAWTALFRESSFAPEGRAALVRRLT